MVGRPCRRCGTGRETLLDVRNWSGDSSGGLELVKDPPGGVELIGRPSRMSRTGRETVPEVRNWLGDLLRSGTGRETLPEVRKWFRDPPGGSELVLRPFLVLELVGRPSWKSGSGRETLPEVQNWLEDPP